MREKTSLDTVLTFLKSAPKPPETLISRPIPQQTHRAQHSSLSKLFVNFITYFLKLQLPFKIRLYLVLN